MEQEIAEARAHELFGIPSVFEELPPRTDAVGFCTLGVVEDTEFLETLEYRIVVLPYLFQ